MIESCSQTGHCRRIASAQPAAQSVSSLCGGTESGIKRIVSIGALLRDIDLPRSAPEAELFLLKRKSQRGGIKRIVSYCRSSSDIEAVKNLLRKRSSS